MVTRIIRFVAVTAVAFLSACGGSSGGGSSASTPAAGSLDVTFGSGGKVTTFIGTQYSDFAYAVALQSDGKIIAVGYTFNGSNNDFALARYTANGGLDGNFGIGGKVITPIGSSHDVAVAVALQGDGKIVVAGSVYNGSNYDFGIARYNVDGTLDTSFDSDGKVTTAIGPGDDYATAVVVQPDGKILVSGYASNGSTVGFAVVRYNTDGSLDSGFGSNGKVTTSIGTGNSIAKSMALQSDGKIVVAGYNYNGTDEDFALVRYNSTGSIDTGFGTNGKVTTAIGTVDDEINSIVIQSDGKIVVAGYSYNGSDNDFAVARYNSNGSLDSSFGTNGAVMTPIGTADDAATGVALDPAGKIVAAGYYFDGGNTYHFAVARYNVNGSIDSSFGTNGIVTTAFGTQKDFIYGLLLQPDRKIVAAGFAGLFGSAHAFALVRYNP